MYFKDALRALADGKKIQRSDWDANSYLQLSDDDIFDENNYSYTLDGSDVRSSWEIYTPPAVKKTVTLWRRPWCEVGDEWFQPNYRLSKENFETCAITSSSGFGWKFHGDWESVIVEVDQ